MQTIIRSYRIPIGVIITIAILLVILGQPALVAGRSGSANETVLSQRYLIPAVVYVGEWEGIWHIHELALKGTWQHRDLTEASGATPINGWREAMAYQRSDGVSMVVYLGEDAHIHSLHLELRWVGNDWQEVWHHADLGAIALAPDSVSDPFGYVRSDGINAVVYVSGNGHIHELRLEDTWIHADLTDISSAPPSDFNFTNRPFAYDRGDGVNAIVYKSSTNGHLIELRLDTNVWVWADLTDISIPNAPNPGSAITAYVRSDGIPTINYKGFDNHIHDIRLETDWYYYDLTQATGAKDASFDAPYGYVRGDGINAVVYAASWWPGNYIYELYLDSTGWHNYELTSVPNAVLGFSPKGYVRADSVTAVVYQGVNDHILEIRLERDGWQWSDLSFLAESPDGAYPWPYNRSAVGSTYLPMILH